ncbi:GNAT family N-acetyltransferase [Jeotgalibaca ciconiae]|uniref:GNAT family N-acetyltransferase n=1 Tax=Jeotgalibaca ciconiae TaxID=2496265 RepID=A0A3Q9BJP7_9LACT|nr:GNAT family N-acetyltransferase [Jeotgalibaca ciconiae]AZP03872.1 GNAT family N-acetyltransferase [Jeotgalibaca ciconiae]
MTATLELIAVRDTLQAEDLAELAHTIWHEYYLPLLGQEQVSYMLKTFQSTEKIIADIAENKVEYFIIEADEKEIGYAGIEWQEDSLFISKLYLLKEARGKGYAYQLIQTFIQKAKERSKKTMTLTVNKDNKDSIRFYEKVGFKRIDSVVSPIGNNFVMDDYIYEYVL